VEHNIGMVLFITVYFLIEINEFMSLNFKNYFHTRTYDKLHALKLDPIATLKWVKIVKIINYSSLLLFLLVVFSMVLFQDNFYISITCIMVLGIIKTVFLVYSKRKLGVFI